MEIIIRPSTPQDFPTIHSLFLEFASFQKTPEKVKITVEQMQEDKDLFNCLVAEGTEGKIIGFATWFFAYYSWTGKAIYLDDLYVQDAFRKEGIGGRLLKAVIDLAKIEKCTKVRWLVSKWNTNAIEFYSKKMGAIITDTESCCDLTL
jgi:GNAT superfamily N-acetyltransferase